MINLLSSLLRPVDYITFRLYLFVVFIFFAIQHLFGLPERLDGSYITHIIRNVNLFCSYRYRCYHIYHIMQETFFISLLIEQSGFPSRV
jgi:hypothetical protein